MIGPLSGGSTVGVSILDGNLRSIARPVRNGSFPRFCDHARRRHAFENRWMLDQSLWERPVSLGEYLPWTMGPWLVRGGCGIWHEGLYFVLLESHAGLLENFDHPP